MTTLDKARRNQLQINTGTFTVLDWCQKSFHCLVSIATKATGHESLKLETGTGDHFIYLIDELHVITENKRNQAA